MSRTALHSCATLKTSRRVESDAFSTVRRPALRSLLSLGIPALGASGGRLPPNCSLVVTTNRSATAKAVAEPAAQVVVLRLCSSPSVPPPRYSGRFLIPSRVDHFE